MSDVHEPWVYVVKMQCPKCDWGSTYTETTDEAIPAGREIDAVVMNGDERCGGCGKLWSQMDGIDPNVIETFEARKDYATPDEESSGEFTAEDFEAFQEQVLEVAETSDEDPELPEGVKDALDDAREAETASEVAGVAAEAAAHLEDRGADIQDIEVEEKDIQSTFLLPQKVGEKYTVEITAEFRPSTDDDHRLANAEPAQQPDEDGDTDE